MAAIDRTDRAFGNKPKTRKKKKSKDRLRRVFG